MFMLVDSTDPLYSGESMVDPLSELEDLERQIHQTRILIRDCGSIRDEHQRFHTDAVRLLREVSAKTQDLVQYLENL